MTTISGIGSLQGALAKAMARMEKLRNGEITESNHSVKVTLRIPTAEEQAELKARNAHDAEIFAQMKREALQAKIPIKIENNDTYLPNITSLSLESAVKMKGFVEVDIEQGLDSGNIHGRYGDKPVSSLKDYLSLINDYINSKSASGTSSSATQSSESNGSASSATEDSTATAAREGRSPTLAELIANPPRVTASPNAGRVTATPITPEMQAETAAYKARYAAQQAVFKKMDEDSEKLSLHESNAMYLPNISTLSLDNAKMIKGCVEIDIGTNSDKGMVVSGGYGDKHVDNLKDYLSLISDYINSKSTSDTSPTSAQPSTSAEATPPVTPAATTPATISAPADTVPPTSPSSTPATNADADWTEPVAEPGQNQIFFPNVLSLTRETAAAVYQQVGSMVKTQDISTSVIHAHNGSTGTLSIDTYMSWLAQRAATDIRV